MIPILYQTMTEGTVPTNYGIGALTDCISCKVTEKRNGGYELSLTYAAEGIHASEIQPNRFIKVKPNYTDNAQIFRIYKVGKIMGGKFEVNAQHISYDLSGKVITTGSAANCVAACALLEAQAGNFTISTDKTTVAAFSVSEPSSVRSWFGGKQGSLLDVYGGEWYYDNYSASLKTARGLDRGVTIRYGKNLTQLSQILDMSNLVTGVIPYYIDANGNKTVGTKVSTGLVLDVDKDVAIDFSQEVNPESGTAIATQLANLANRYIANNNLTTFSNSITLDFVQMKGLTERVDLCDTVHIYFEALGITATAKCVAVEWDALEERYTKCTFGDARTDITDKIASATKQLEDTASRAYVNESSQLITGNLGGYVILHDSNGDGKPDELLVMNTEDPSTATQVWRFNKGGLGYGTSYSGPFNDIALTSDGKINASRIVTGTLTANVIKAGTLSDAQGNSSIDMTNGEAVMNNFKAKTNFTLVDANNIGRAGIAYTSANGAGLSCKDPSGNITASIYAGANNDAYMKLSTASGKVVVGAQSQTWGGGIALYDKTTGNTRVSLYADQNNGAMVLYNTSDKPVLLARRHYNGGSLEICNDSGDQAAWLFANNGSGNGALIICQGGISVIDLDGNNGQVTCVSLVQTSSRKTKDNIKPLDDARKVLELDAVKFDYKNRSLGTDRRGFIAEDVAKVLPNLVTPETDERPASLDYLQMIPYLQAVIKEQDERIKAIEDRLNKLEG